MIELCIDPRGEVAIENLEELLERFPGHAERAVASALKSEGYNLKELMKYAILRGGPSGHPWENKQHYSRILTKANTSWQKNFRWEWSTHTEALRGRLKLWKRDKSERPEVWLAKRYYVPGMGMTKLYSRGKKPGERTFEMVRKAEGKKKREIKRWLWQQREDGYDTRSREFRPFQKLAGGLRYKYDDAQSLMSVGFVNEDGPISQNFARLIKMHASGFETPTSKKFQRLAWALGMRLNTGTRLKVPARPLVEPVFQQEKDKMGASIRAKILNKISQYIREGK